MFLKEFNYQDPEYQMTLRLRDKVMRIPLGLSIYDEDLDAEKDAFMVGAFDDDGNMLGCGILSYNNVEYKVDFLCVDTDVQTNGIGKTLLNYLENHVKELGESRVVLEARKTALGFYQKNHYQEISPEYPLAICSQVILIKMEKALVS